MSRPQAESHDEAHELIDGLPDAVLIVDPANGAVVESNAHARALLGIRMRDAHAASIEAIKYERLREQIGEQICLPDLQRLEFEVAPSDKDDNRYFFVTLGAITRCSRRLVVVVVRDVTAQWRVEHALRESEERFMLAACGANDGLWDWDLRTNRVYYSPRWKAMLGFADEEIVESPNEWFVRIHPGDVQKVYDLLTRHLEGETPHFEVECRVLHKNGTYRWMQTRGLLLRDAVGRPNRMAGSQSEVTDRRNAERELVRMAYFDALTDLPNRSFFLQQLERTIERTKREPDYSFAVLFLDLDRFKVVNDSLGHIIGDQLLVGIAERVKECIRPMDIFARLYGDEFAVLVNGIGDGDAAVRIAERIQHRLAEPFALDRHEVFTSASIGVALSSTGYASAEQLMREADLAMYQAKTEGRARFVVFDARLHSKALRMVTLENDLRVAIDRDELEIYFQPIVTLDTGRLVSLEALARWRHAEQGLVSPAEFIPIAEETGLIVQIDRWIFRHACLNLAAWQRRHPAAASLSVNVNFSSKQFSRNDLIEFVDEVIAETGVAASCIAIEITESVLMLNTEATTKMLLNLRSRGIRLYIDDFGTGYSSLSYLTSLPIHGLKIDRSFVGGMDEGESPNAEIVRAIATLAHSLSLSVVAEGVETPSQADSLRALACDLGQGFYFARPMPETDAARLVGAEFGADHFGPDPPLLTESSEPEMQASLIVSKTARKRERKASIVVECVGV